MVIVPMGMLLRGTFHIRFLVNILRDFAHKRRPKGGFSEIPVFSIVIESTLRISSIAWGRQRRVQLVVRTNGQFGGRVCDRDLFFFSSNLLLQFIFFYQNLSTFQLFIKFFAFVGRIVEA